MAYASLGKDALVALCTERGVAFGKLAKMAELRVLLEQRDAQVAAGAARGGGGVSSSIAALKPAKRSGAGAEAEPIVVAVAAAGGPSPYDAMGKDELVEELELRNLPTHGKMIEMRARLRAHDAKAAEDARRSAAPKAAAGASAAAATSTKGVSAASASAGGRAPSSAASASAPAAEGIDIRSAYRNAPATHKRRDDSLLGKLKRNAGRVTCCVGLLGLAAGIAVAVTLAPAASSSSAARAGPSPSAAPSARASPTTATAYAYFDNRTGGLWMNGYVWFEQHYSGGQTNFTVNLQGFGITAGVTRHGFHVHTNGDCGSPGPHLNGPFPAVHGSPLNLSSTGALNGKRHAGDLGNIDLSPQGQISYAGSDTVLSLRPADVGYNIVGRALMIHVGQDDLGFGANSGSNCGPTGTGNCTSLLTGNAGAQLACAIITQGGALRRR